MIRAERSERADVLGIPRESGDDPDFDVVIHFEETYSPRERG